MASSHPVTAATFEPSGFFVLRTPLLPIDELLAWGGGLEAPRVHADLVQLATALAADRAHLHERLRTAMVRPELREALFIASPDLESRFDIWKNDPDSERGRSLEQPILRYFLRMASRPTPFGLCSGCSVGLIGDRTRLVREGRERAQRHTRLDMDYLHTLAEALARDKNLRGVFSYSPNSSLYRAAGRWRYVESYLQDGQLKYRLVAVDETDTLNATLTRARGGSAFANLAAALLDDDVSQTEADEYIGTLIENQLLVPEIDLFVTGPGPLHALIDQLSRDEHTAPMAEALHRMRDECVALDKAGIGNSPERYRAAAKLLSDLPGKADITRLFQVEMMTPAPQARLGGRVLEEIKRGIELLRRLTPPLPTALDDLHRFRSAFAARYEQRAVPLTEALDGEIGIGFPVSDGTAGEASPLLKGLGLETANEQSYSWTARDAMLLRKLCDALQKGAQEIMLEPRELEEWFVPNPAPLPDAFTAIASVAAASDEALESGDFRIALVGAGGPSGVVLFGRFCHADDSLREHVDRHLRAEEALRPDAIFAEIVHLPEGRLGNVLARPVLRDYEIPYLGRSCIPEQRQISVDDLHLVMRGDRLVLYSKRLGREVIPRLTSAHHYAVRSLAVYRFLCTLQRDGSTSVGWDWGCLQGAPFLPRVSTGKLVLARAQWRVAKEELRRLAKVHDAERYRAVREWREERKLPRFAALVEGDHELFLDLDNALCVDTFVDMVKARDVATLIEVFPAPDLLGASGPDGRYAHELVIPFVRCARDEPVPNVSQTFLPPPADPAAADMVRTFPPGSGWLYARVYTGVATADRVLTEVVAPLVDKLVGCGAVDRWFFLRHGDPEPHLRLRFRGDPHRLHAGALPVLQAAIAPLLQDGCVRRLQLDTYEREIERYGGAESMELAEQVFQFDSEAALEILDQLEPGDVGLDERWRLTLCSMHDFITDFGLDLATRASLMHGLRGAYEAEFGVETRLRIQLGDRFRKEKRELEALLDPAQRKTHPLAPGLAIFEHRSARLKPVIAALRGYEQAGRLTETLTNIVASFLHMTANRLLRSAQRTHELVLYDFLARLYEAQCKRQ